MRLVRLSFLIATASVAACASNTATTVAGPVRWAGAFRTSQMATTPVIGSAQHPGRAAGYGNITLTPSADPRGQLRVELSISAPVDPGSQIGWAVFSGPCGTPSPPLAGPQEFPTIEVANSGSGTVRTMMSLTLDTHDSYHANVYWSSQVSDVSNVMMCANLALTGG